MTAMLIGFLFFLAMMMALGTIAGMTHAYGGKAMAALRLNLRPAAEPDQRYSPVRPPRPAASFRVDRPLARHARAA